MDFMQAVKYMLSNPKAKLKANRWQDGHYITLHESKDLIITQDGDYYSPYPKTILNDEFEVIQKSKGIKIEETKTKHKVLDIAKYIAYKSTNDLKAVSNLHLNRLLFFIQGEYFIKTGDFLFQDDFKAYPYGVIMDEVYHEYRYYGGSNIYESEQRIPLDIRTEIIIDRILEKFYNISYYKIVNMTQREGGAWDTTYENGLGKRGIILKKLIVKDCLHYIDKEISKELI